MSAYLEDKARDIMEVASSPALLQYCLEFRGIDPSEVRADLSEVHHLRLYYFS